MATTHYSNFGAQQPPQVANRDGYITYSRRDVERLEHGLDPSGRESEGTLWVADASRAVAQSRG